MNALSLFAFFLMSIFGQQSSHQLVIRGVSSSKGQIYIGIYNKQNGFPEVDKTYKNYVIPANKNVSKLVLADLSSGEYAISVFHDENMNGKLDTGVLGIPTEKYGFSNNAKGAFGPPKFDECVVKLGAKSSTEITIN